MRHSGCAVQVLAAGPDDWVHPASRKAKLWVNLQDLQAETGLTDAAAQHIALVCGSRRAPLSHGRAGRMRWGMPQGKLLRASVTLLVQEGVHARTLTGLDGIADSLL